MISNSHKYPQQWRLFDRFEQFFAYHWKMVNFHVWLLFCFDKIHKIQYKQIPVNFDYHEKLNSLWNSNPFLKIIVRMSQASHDGSSNSTSLECSKFSLYLLNQTKKLWLIAKFQNESYCYLGVNAKFYPHYWLLSKVWISFIHYFTLIGIFLLCISVVIK